MSDAPQEREVGAGEALNAAEGLGTEAPGEAAGGLVDPLSALADRLAGMIDEARDALECKLDDVADEVHDARDALEDRLTDLSDRVDDLERGLRELVADPWQPTDPESVANATAWSDQPLEPAALAATLASCGEALTTAGCHRAAEYVRARGVRTIESLVTGLVEASDADLESRITSNDAEAMRALRLLRLAGDDYDEAALESLLAGPHAGSVAPPSVPDRCVRFRGVLEALPRMIWRAARWLLAEADYELILPEVEKDRLDERVHRPVRAIETPRAGKNDVIAEVVFPGLRRGDRIVRAQVVHYYPTGASAPRYG